LRRGRQSPSMMYGGFGRPCAAILGVQHEQVAPHVHYVLKSTDGNQIFGYPPPPHQTMQCSTATRNDLLGSRSHDGTALQFGLEFNAVRRRPGKTSQGRWSCLNRSERLSPELLMRLGFAPSGVQQALPGLPGGGPDFLSGQRWQCAGHRVPGCWSARREQGQWLTGDRSWCPSSASSAGSSSATP
jgi:hypothetical protein